MDQATLHFNRGIVLSLTLYNCLIGTGWFNSPSDIFRKLIQSKAKHPASITPGLQLFKLMKSGDLNLEKMETLAFKYAPGLEEDWIDISSDDIPENVGTWWLVKLFIDFATDSTNNQAEGFLCKFEDLIFDEQLAIEDCTQNGSSTVADNVARKWLDIDGFADLADNRGKQNSYVVRQNLMLLALFEHLLRAISKEFCQRYPEPGSMGFLLPTCDGETLLLSNRKLFDRVKNKVSMRAGVKLRSWDSLYNQIAESQESIKSFSGSDVAAIKRNVERIKAGKTKLTLSNYKNLVRILDPELYRKPMQLGEFIAPISQAFTQLQLDLQRRQCTGRQICEYFSYYHQIYKKLDAHS